MKGLKSTTFKKTGVYIIENMNTNKCYIGSTKKYFSHRIGNHINQLRKGTHHSKKLQRSFNKHGESAFKFRILEICDLDQVREKEQEWIDTMIPFYNMTLSVECNSKGMLGRTHTEETKVKMSKASKGVTKSEKHKVSISESMKNQWESGLRENGPRSESSKVKQARTKFDGILEVSKNEVPFVSFLSIKECSETLGLVHSSIQYCISGKRNSLYKHTFKKLSLEADFKSGTRNGDLLEGEQ